jgi:membrane peptidoglycan carboxypeptidase
MARRDYILDTLTKGRWTHLTAAEIAAAKAEPAILVGDRPIIYKAPHFMWRVREELVARLGSLEAVETGGYRVITTLDWKAQELAEKYITTATVLPHVSQAKAARLIKTLHISARDRTWAMRLGGRGPRNGAMVALDYRTGDVLAYVGSAGYYRDDMRSRRFEPKFDVLSQGYRQPGSAWKPIVYATAFDRHKLTPSSLLLDVTTGFARRWAPHDADRRERGPVLVREALQWSLNIPAIRALDRVGSKAVAAQAERMGIRLPGGAEFFRQAGLSAAIGTVEVRPLDLTAAYGVLANGGRLAPPRTILTVDGPDGQPVWSAGKPDSEEVLDPRAAFLVTEIIAGNTDPKQNPVWARVLRLGNGPGGKRRPAAAKTGTTNETLDYATYGFLAPPKDPKAPGVVVGVWMGNSDHSESRGGGREVISLDGPARVWQAFMRDYTRSLPISQFQPPDGLVRARIDAWTGGKPGPWTRLTTTAWFIKGTQPGTKRAVDKAGLMYVRSCGGWRIDLTKAEPERAWHDDVLDWMRRARSGSGRFGRYKTATAYLPGRSGWGGLMLGSCAPPPDDPCRAGPGNGNGNGTGTCDPSPSPGPTPAPSPPATAPRRRRLPGRRTPRRRGPRRQAPPTTMSAEGAAGRRSPEEPAAPGRALPLAVLDDDLASGQHDV